MNITNDLVTQYINGFYTPLDDEISRLRSLAEEQRVPIILRETESVLGFLVRALRPQRVLEIGAAVGYSAAFFAKSGAKQVVTVEKDEAMADKARSNVNAMGLEDRIRVITGDGEEAVREDLSEEEPFDLVFIDAAKSHYKRFLDACLPLCRDGALIISDNVLLKAATASDQFDPGGRFKTNVKNMRIYLKYISEHPNLDTTIMSCGDGLALSRYKI